MNLRTFVERFEGYDLGRDQAKICADLRRLATHKTLLSEHLYQTLQRDGYSTRNSLYNAYAFVLHTSDAFSVRLSFWAPVTSQDESETFIYHLNHTHDFEMYAVGYSGDGYTTVKCEILDQAPLQVGVRPALGEEVTLKLAPGEVLHMQPFREAHRQLPPKSLSSSLSVLIHAPLTQTSDEAWCLDEHYVPTYPGIATQETAFYERALSLLSQAR